jgi:hypothetical protein
VRRFTAHHIIAFRTLLYETGLAQQYDFTLRRAPIGKKPVPLILPQIADMHDGSYLIVFPTGAEK